MRGDFGTYRGRFLTETQTTLLQGTYTLKDCYTPIGDGVIDERILRIKTKTSVAVLAWNLDPKRPSMTLRFSSWGEDRSMVFTVLEQLHHMTEPSQVRDCLDSVGLREES